MSKQLLSKMEKRTMKNEVELRDRLKVLKESYNSTENQDYRRGLKAAMNMLEWVLGDYD